jgi:hypothetical protein
VRIFHTDLAGFWGLVLAARLTGWRAGAGVDPAAFTAPLRVYTLALPDIVAMGAIDTVITVTRAGAVTAPRT